MNEPPALDVTGLDVVFKGRRGQPAVHAVQGVDLRIARGETLGLVGESGSGKSTTARGLMRLIEPTAGTVRINGEEFTGLPRRQLRAARKDIQMVFQDPFSSLNPARVIGLAVAEPIELHDTLDAADREARVRDLLAHVSLSPDHYERYPYEFSGGQRQRIAIARAIAVNPSVVVCDEAVSALDVSTQSEIINLLETLQDELQLALLFISHDLAVVRHIADRIAVMYLGRIVEEGPSERIVTAPTHPYTKMLLQAVPDPHAPGRLIENAASLQGELPDPSHPPSGCPFRTRCPIAVDTCAESMPEPREVPAGGLVRCHEAEL